MTHIPENLEPLQSYSVLSLGFFFLPWTVNASSTLHWVPTALTDCGWEKVKYLSTERFDLEILLPVHNSASVLTNSKIIFIQVSPFHLSVHLCFMEQLNPRGIWTLGVFLLNFLICILTIWGVFDVGTFLKSTYHQIRRILIVMG